MKRKLNLTLRLLLVLTLSLCVITLSACGSKSVAEIPDDYYCYDGASVLSQSVEDAIHYNTTQLCRACGSEIFVVSVTNIDGMTMDNYTLKLFNQLKVGDPDKNNGFLLAMLPASYPPDGKFWIISGKGASVIIDDAELDELLEDYFAPQFDAGNYDDATIAIYRQLFNRVCEYYNLSLSFASPEEFSSSTAQSYTPSAAAGRIGGGGTTKSSSGGGFTVFWIILIVVIIIIASTSFGASRRRRGGYVPPIVVTPPRRTPPPPRSPMAPPRAGGGAYRPAQPRSGSYRSTPSRSGSFGAGRSGSFGGSSRPSSSGRSVSSGRVGGGGASRGTGAGRR